MDNKKLINSVVNSLEENGFTVVGRELPEVFWLVAHKTIKIKNDHKTVLFLELNDFVSYYEISFFLHKETPRIKRKFKFEDIVNNFRNFSQYKITFEVIFDLESYIEVIVRKLIENHDRISLYIDGNKKYDRFFCTGIDNKDNNVSFAKEDYSSQVKDEHFFDTSVGFYLKPKSHDTGKDVN